jgi:hypothetical protein
MEKKILHINFQNANSRETYYSMHNVKNAHKYGKGKGVKVGILDWCFGQNEYSDLYADCVDMSNSKYFTESKPEHGYWMACALREIAPECDIYAINYLNGSNSDCFAKEIEQAILWAADNKINILTYSNRAFKSGERIVVDKAVEIAVSKGMIPTFIPYDNDNNIIPGALLYSHYGNREPDVKILHYDYNTLFLDRYEKYKSTTKSDMKSGDDIPYFSISSTSPVLAGFIAIMKSIDDSLTADDCKKILKETSYTACFEGYAPFDDLNPENVADIGKAAEMVYNNKFAK